MIDKSSAPVLREGDANRKAEKIADINLQFKERDIKARAKKLGLKYINLKKSPLNQDALHLTSWEEIEAHEAVAFNLIGKELHIASIEPESKKYQELVAKFQEKGYEVITYICSSEGIASTRHYFESFEKSGEYKVRTEVEETKVGADWQKMFEDIKEVFEKGTGPEMINEINLQSVRFRASDVHFQPELKEVVIRFRRDGELYDVMKMTAKQFLLLSGEIKRAAGLKINIKDQPQDGEYEFTVNDRRTNVRVSTLPSNYGESIVLRILDPTHAMIDLNKMGYSDANKKIILEKLKSNKGLILVTGPTGSGKTSTLYSCLNILNTSDKKIITLEDPIEFKLRNVIQSQINESEDYNFTDGLRAILRQDPDVIMLGEIRDKEAAEIALQASLTGHLVLSTVHSNDAIATIPRLLNMGVKPFILSSGLELIISQRLVRRVCQNCRVAAEVDPQAKEDIQRVVESLQSKGVEIKAQEVFAAKGCDQCANTGYDGRIAIAEVFSISDSIRSGILAGDSVLELLEKANREGFVNIREDGILKVLEGSTTLEEIAKIIK